ncbi:uncharacterized protein LOC108203764 [Daucus carota subsp. sativus]|uniref:uncharacterized protein LOC108203764 n=1 Tax=Daucus carota subsp. sativus TaxID=79200 RepID=UPI0007EEF77B|nr:PREDICTED: uncharacterized protein LOC108203764 [Daucus carota subsp. sativus]
MEIPQKVSWCPRKILQARHLALRFINYEVGSGSLFSFWHDPWVDGASLLSKCHPTIISLADSSTNALAGQYILNGSWNLPPSNHLDLRNLRRIVSAVPIRGRDNISWNSLTGNMVRVSSIWNSMHMLPSPPMWTSAVWHPLAIPKCAFTLWLALKGRLLTKDRMQRFNMQTDLKCELCHNAVENHSHIFGSCPFIDFILSGHSFQFTGCWESYVRGNFLLGRPQGIRKQLGALFIAISIYLVWQERNARIHNRAHPTPESIIRFNAKRMLREKLHSCHQFQKAVLKDNNLVMDLY